MRQRYQKYRQGQTLRLLGLRREKRPYLSMCTNDGIAYNPRSLAIHPAIELRPLNISVRLLTLVIPARAWTAHTSIEKAILFRLQSDPRHEADRTVPEHACSSIVSTAPPDSIASAAQQERHAMQWPLV